MEAEIKQVQGIIFVVFMLLLENCFLWNGGKKTANVLIENNKIVQITEESLSCENTIDCGEKILLPGIIDSHVHFRFPGQEHKETWGQGSRAAVAGGVTTVLEMPNTMPAATGESVLEMKRKNAAENSLCNYGFYIGATVQNVADIHSFQKIAGIKAYIGSSTGNLLLDRKDDIKRLFEAAKARNMLVAVHAEDEEIMEKNSHLAKNRMWNHAKYHSRIRTVEAEAIAVEKLLEIQALVGNKMHICHVSSKRTLDLIMDAKQQGQWVTAEACVPHLFMTEEIAENIGNFAKVNPSLKGKGDMAALWQFLRKGVIDTIATDHAPHTKEEKSLTYTEAPSGLPGVQTMLPLLLHAVNYGEISLEKLAEMCCSNPAKIFGIKERGSIQEGMIADLTLVDFDAEQEIKNEEQYSKCGWTPFHGWKTKGKVLKTFVNGNLVFDEGVFGEAKGVEVFSE